MSTQPPLRSYRTARERVAARRRHIAHRRRGCHPLLIGALVLAAVIGGLLFFATRRATETLQAIEQSDPRHPPASDSARPAAAPAAAPATLREPFNVLLVGIDRRDDPHEGVRSDTLIVVHINPVERWAGMLSIPRDSVVAIPSLGQQKINTAYAYGYMNAAALYGEDTDPTAAGGALVAETVENFLGLRIDYIAQVDFRGFEQIIDTLGGIAVDVDQPLLDAEYPTETFGYERIYVPAGLQVLDGRTALRYARSRHSSTDFDRSRRQQQVLRAILREVRARGILDQAALLPDLARDLEQTVNTTLPISNLDTLRDLVSLAQGLSPDRIVQLSINPNEVAMISEYGSDIYWNQEDVRALVARLLAGPTS